MKIKDWDEELFFWELRKSFLNFLKVSIKKKWTKFISKIFLKSFAFSHNQIDQLENFRGILSQKKWFIMLLRVRKTFIEIPEIVIKKYLMGNFSKFMWSFFFFRIIFLMKRHEKSTSRIWKNFFFAGKISRKVLFFPVCGNFLPITTVSFNVQKNSFLFFSWRKKSQKFSLKDIEKKIKRI